MTTAKAMSIRRQPSGRTSAVSAGPSPQSRALRAGVPAVRAGFGGDRFRAVQRLVGLASPRALYQHRQRASPDPVPARSRG